MVKTISAGAILLYSNFVTGKVKTDKELFAMFSVSIGGDGKSITKSQLSSYIKAADDKVIQIGEKRLNKLKTLEKNWDEMFNKKDSISLEDFKKAMLHFVDIMTSEDNEEKLEDKFIKEKKEKKEKADKEKKNSINEVIDQVKKEKESVTKKDLQDYLNELIDKNTNGCDTSDEIDSVVNIISEFDDLADEDGFLFKNIQNKQNTSKKVDFKI